MSPLMHWVTSASAVGIVRPSSRSLVLYKVRHLWRMLHQSTDFLFKWHFDHRRTLKTRSYPNSEGNSIMGLFASWNLREVKIQSRKVDLLFQVRVFTKKIFFPPSHIGYHESRYYLGRNQDHQKHMVTWLPNIRKTWKISNQPLPRQPFL